MEHLTTMTKGWIVFYKFITEMAKTFIHRCCYLKCFAIIMVAFPLISLQTSAQDQPADTQRGVEVKEKGLPSNITIEGDYWALIIGINEYLNLPADKQLEAARPDAQAVADILQKKYGFSNERIIELYDKKATRSEIIKKLRILAKTLTEKDSLLIYYAGHGEYDKDTSLGGWIPSDAVFDDTSTYVSNEEIRGYLKAIKAKHIYTIADSCFSESLMGKTRSIGPISDAAIEEMYKEKSRWVLTSGGLYPVPDKGKGGHSTFAYYFVKILEKNENRYLTPQEIIPELQRLVSNESQQTPKSSPIAGIGDEGGQFVFVLAVAKVPSFKDTKGADKDLIREELKRLFEEERARLEEDKRKLKEKELEVERELKEKGEKLEEEKKAQQIKLEEEKRRLEMEKKEQQRKMENEKRQMEQQQKELEKQKQREKPVFMPPAF